LKSQINRTSKEGKYIMKVTITQLLRSAPNGAKRIFVGLVFVVMGMFPHQDATANPITYGVASSFAILAGSGITDVPGSSKIIGDALTGNVGTSPITGASITGLLPGQVGGTIYAVDVFGPAGIAGNNPGLVGNAISDFGTAYTTAAGETPFTNLGQQIGGLTLVPGVYRLPDIALLNGTLTLNANNVIDPVWIFQATSSLITASDSRVVFLNSVGTPCDVLWQVPTQVTLGTYSDFVGTIMAGSAIVFDTGATLHGRAWAGTAVTLDHNTITGLPCTTLGGNVPDTGSTLLLLGSGLAILFILRQP
jgi:hypothetical protein